MNELPLMNQNPFIFRPQQGVIAKKNYNLHIIFRYIGNFKIP